MSIGKITARYEIGCRVLVADTGLIWGRRNNIGGFFYAGMLDARLPLGERLRQHLCLRADLFIDSPVHSSPPAVRYYRAADPIDRERSFAPIATVAPPFYSPASIIQHEDAASEFFSRWKWFIIESRSTLAARLEYPASPHCH